MFTAHFHFLLFLFWGTLLLLNYPPSIITEIKMAKATTLKEFEAVFPKLVEDILEHAGQYKLPAEFAKWFKAVSGIALCHEPLLLN
jgi:hypothetical protein